MLTLNCITDATVISTTSLEGELYEVRNQKITERLGEQTSLQTAGPGMKAVQSLGPPGSSVHRLLLRPALHSLSCGSRVALQTLK